MWKTMTAEQVQRWMNSGWSPDVREVGDWYEYWDTRKEGHEHTVGREEVSAPDFYGSFTVKKWCECGVYLGYHTDSIL